MSKTFAIGLFGVLSSASFGQLVFDLNGIQGTSRGAQRWDGNAVAVTGLIQNNNTGSVFINSVEFVEVAGDWSTLSVGGSATLNSLLGVEIVAGQIISPFFLSGLIRVAFNDEANTTYGVRSGTIRLRGGSTSTSDEVLAEDGFDFDVYDGWGGISASILNPVQSIAPGQSTDPFRWRIQTGSVPIWSWVATTGVSSTTNVNLVDFGQWPTSSDVNRILNPNEIWEGDSVRYQAAANAPFGSQVNLLRSLGGRYNGDQDFMTSTEHTINVVPEPGTMAALGLGALALLRRRKKA